MNDKLSHLESLARLTRENSDDGRQKLLHEVTNLFMQAPESLSEREIAYFGEIMGGIATQVETAVRQHLSERISAVSNAPHNLVHALANDEITVALPILVSSDALSDDDLVGIVGKQSQEHLKAISMRPTVSETVTDALVVKGDEEVLGTLAGNHGAQFSRTGMETIIERTKDNEDISKTLVNRIDVPDDLTQEMFWRVSWAMREQILSADGDLDESQVDALMKETEHWFEEQKDSRKLDPAEKFITRKEKMDQLDNGLLIQLMRQEKIPEVVAGLARLAKIDLEIARQSIFDASGEKLAVACKALDMDYDMFGEILMLADADGVRTADDTEALLGVYNRFTPQIAQRSLRFLRTRKSMLARTA